MEDKVRVLIFHSLDEFLDYLQTEEPGGMVDLRIEMEDSDEEDSG